jgi:hypothetical protein
MAQRLQGFMLHDLWTRGDDPALWTVTDADRVVDVDDPTRVFKIHTPGMDMTGVAAGSSSSSPWARLTDERSLPRGAEGRL